MHGSRQERRFDRGEVNIAVRSNLRQRAVLDVYGVNYGMGQAARDLLE